MTKIIALTDYKDRFGSKHFDKPYRSGMDKLKLKEFLLVHDYDIEFIKFTNINFHNQSYYNKIFIYTSSEDPGYYYKSFAEDIIYGLELVGAIVVPAFKYLRANNNKVFMEMLSDQMVSDKIKKLKSQHFGSLEDLLTNVNNIKFPCVIKSSAGASGTGVQLIENEKILIKKVKKISRTKNLKYELWDKGRSLKHKDYSRDSKYRNKFIIQDFVPNLKNDWKIYLFGDKLYIFNRPILKGRGIKASGGGYDNYYYGLEAKVPKKIFDFAYKIFKILDLPHLSLDIAYDGEQFYLLEFQAIYFGTAGIPYSNGYFQKRNDEWIFFKKELEIEQVYADSIVWYLKN